MNEVAVQTMHAVSREIGNSLGEARGALEMHVEQPDNKALLDRCVRELHLVQGALRIMEIYGAALLAEEMEQVGLYLTATAAERKNQSEALDALMRALVQLPGYLERVMAGGRDLALVLLPLLNDLRAVRGSALLSEGTLLLLNLKSDRKAEPARPVAGEPSLNVAQWARRLRANFQTGLIGWIRGERIEKNLELLDGVARRIEQVATDQSVFQLWWVIGALIEALRENGIEGSVSVKRLLGLADRELKRLHQVGEARYAQNPPVELLNNLLYYIARASTAGSRVSMVRASFRLSELLPVDDSVEQERDNLSAPSVKLMQTVAAAIREDLTRVKDVLDLYARRGGGQAQELNPQLELLRKIGDTLGVLGLGELRASVRDAGQRLEALIAGTAAVDEAALVQIAAMLIHVEDRLDSQLVGLILPRERRADGEPANEEDPDFRQVQGAVLRECVVNLARVKDSVAQNLSGSLDAAGLDSWPDLMRGIKAGLLMLGRSRAVEVVDAISVQLKRVMQPGVTTASREHLDRLADAIVSIEYYIETLQAGRNDPWYMLDNAEVCLKVLAAEPISIVPTIEPLTPGVYSRTVRIAPPSGAETTITESTTARNRALPAVVPVVAPVKTPVRTPTLVDPDLARLFAEEAREELTVIQKSFPMWDASPQETEALARVRRCFHTLKGSGRMVGANTLAEFAWAIENLLNRLLDGTVTRTIAGLEVLRGAVGLLPALVNSLEGAVPAPKESDVYSLASRAHALAAGKDPATAGGEGAAPRPTKPAVVIAPAIATAAPRVVPAAAEVEAVHFELGPELFAPGADAERAAPPTISQKAADDAVLHDIYARETAGHVAAMRRWLAAEARRPAPHLLSEEAYRACHTLTGSSRMADVRHGVRLAEPLNRWLRKSFDSGVGLDDADLQVVVECVTAMDDVAAHLNESTGYFQVHGALRARIARAEQMLERRIAEAAEMASRSQSTQVLVLPEMSTPPAAAPMDIDPEVAGIFCEEATELLEASQSALQDWNAQPGNSEAVAALKRPIHTLKGGARMAGIAAMGDLAHELESLISQIELGVTAGDEAARAVVQQAVDELARMREQVVGTQRVQTNPAVTAAIARHLRGESPLESPLELPLESPQQSLHAEPVSEPPPLRAAPMPPAEISLRAFTPPPVPVASAPPVRPLASAPPPELGPADATQRVRLPNFSAVAEPPELEATQSVPAPAALPPGRETGQSSERGEMARVSAELLDQLLNCSGEVSTSRARLEQQLGSVDFNLSELSRTVVRLKEQLRRLEIETEAQILHRRDGDSPQRAHFDPLELDRYSSLQQFSRALAESASDVASLQQVLESQLADAQELLQQQSRTVTELQNGLMRTRMVSMQRHLPRLARIVRQAAADAGKQAELTVIGGSGELDRQVLERMLPPFEHLLRNSVVHGIESPERRAELGKPQNGQITLELRREGSEVIVSIRDDGAGMNLAAIRAKGEQLGLISAGQKLADDDVMQLILEPGFSTASALTQQAGRGVGMDVVATEIKKLGGSLLMESVAGQGSRFTIRLPFTLAVSNALVVRAGEEHYALPLPTIEGVVRVPRDEVATHLRGDSASFLYGNTKYRLQPLALYVGAEPDPLPESEAPIAVVLVRAGEHSTGIVADELVGSREIVVKPIGPQVASIRGISGATILSDGRVVVILDIGALVRFGRRGRGAPTLLRERDDQRAFALVVDDSITVRRVTQRLLERNGMRVMTARDGMDAMQILQEHVPDIILLDIEMPRMDGYELAAHVRSEARLREVPIIMITSRVGEKHRARAIELGVNDYLGKPYQESQLIDAIAPLVAQRRAKAARSQ